MCVNLCLDQLISDYFPISAVFTSPVVSGGQRFAPRPRIRYIMSREKDQIVKRTGLILCGDL